MIFGKSYEEKYTERQAYYKSIYRKIQCRFAWVPFTLNNDRWIWLQKFYYVEQSVYQYTYSKETYGEYSSHSIKAYATEREAAQHRRDLSAAELF